MELFGRIICSGIPEGVVGEPVDDGDSIWPFSPEKKILKSELRNTSSNFQKEKLVFTHGWSNVAAPQKKTDDQTSILDQFDSVGMRHVLGAHAVDFNQLVAHLNKQKSIKHNHI